VTYLASKAIEFGEITQNKAYQVQSQSFKVIEVGINQKLVCDFLLVININCHLISCRLGVVTAYYSSFGHLAFMSPLWGLETTYDVHLGLIGKRVVEFL